MKKPTAAALAALLAVLALTGCGHESTRQIDPKTSKSFKIEGTSWYAFCQGPNLFVWAPSGSAKPGTDPDGIVDDEEN